MNLRSRPLHAPPNTTATLFPQDNYSDSRRSLLGYDAQPRTPSNSFDFTDQMLLQRRNDQDIDEIRQRVTTIRHISEEIEAGIQEGNQRLDEFNSSMDQVSALLASSMAQLKELTHSASSRHMIYLFIFVFLILVGLYVYIR